MDQGGRAASGSVYMQSETQKEKLKIEQAMDISLKSFLEVHTCHLARIGRTSDKFAVCHSQQHLL
jgi:hypothetical protein